MGNSAWDNIKRFWQAWVRVARRIGNFQAHVLLTILYALVLLPFGVCVRLFADTLRTKERPTGWLDRTEQTVDMPWAHKQ
jgi:hypothetical protein